jgi:signal peptidase I
MIVKMSEKKILSGIIHPFALIDSAWQEYLKHIPFYTKLVLPPVLFYLVLDTLSYVSEHGVSGQPLVVLAQTIEHTLPLILLLYVLAFLLQTFSTAAVLSTFINPKITSTMDAYRQGTKKITSLWWVSLLSFLVIGGGFFLFFVPGLIFSVWFTFSQYVLFAENKRGADTLRQSREYVRGYFWQIAGRILFIILIAGALSSISGYISVIFNNGLVAQIAQSIVSLVTIPLVMLYQYKLYLAMLGKKEQVEKPAQSWWLYAVASVMPFVVILTLGTIFIYLKPFQVSDESMRPTYKKGEYLLMGEFPGVTGTTTNIIYKKDGKLLIRRVLASFGEKIQRKGNTVTVVTKKDGNALLNHEAVYAFSFFTPPLPLADGKELLVGVDDIYVASENVSSVKQTWEKITIDNVVGVPLFCYWNCTGNE